MIKIVQKEDSVLHEKAQEVPMQDIPSPKIQKVIRDMKTALANEKDGVAIAAPQIGVPLRIFVVSGAFLEIASGKENTAKDSPLQNKGESFVGNERDLVFINPEITKLSKQKESMQEGCLSVRWLYGEVRRSKKATVKAYDENGKAFTRGAGGLLAQIFQHEVDHLNGVLFVDKAKNVEEILPEEHSDTQS